MQKRHLLIFGTFLLSMLLYVDRACISAAKGGIIAFTKAAAKELIGKGIYVNALAPGFVETDGLRGSTTVEGKALSDFIQAVFGTIPLGRLGTPEEVTPLAVFLASDESSFMVGQVLSANGGQVI